MKTCLGLDLKRSFWYELSSWRAYLARRHSGAADRFAHSAGPSCFLKLILYLVEITKLCTILIVTHGVLPHIVLALPKVHLGALRIASYCIRSKVVSS